MLYFSLHQVLDINTSLVINSFPLQVLTITVLVILITAPLGAVAIMLSAPKLLSKGKTKDTLDLPDGLPDP